MSNERQINYVNEIQNRVQNLYYVDDASELNSIDLKENDKIYAINDNKLFQMEIADQDEELSGSIVSFNGRNNTKIKSVVTNIEPVQDLHGYNAPWPAGGGKNLLDLSNLSLITCYVSNNQGGYIEQVRRGKRIDLPPGTYTFSGVNKTSNTAFIYIDQMNADGSVVGFDYWIGGVATVPSRTKTLSAGQYFIVFDQQAKNTSDTNKFDYFNLQLEEGSTATSYAPYENICLISGWTGVNITETGKNMCSPSAIINGKYIRAGNTSESNPLGSETVNSSFACTDYIRVKTSTAYTTCVPHYTPGNAAGLVFYSDTSVSDAISGVSTYNQQSGVYSFTTPSNCKYVRFSWGNSPSTTYPYPMLVEGIDTVYEEYRAATLPINWQSEAGTIYGGTVTLNEDGSADVVVDRAFAQKTLSEASSQTVGEVMDSYRFNNCFPSTPVGPTSYTGKISNIAVYSYNGATDQRPHFYILATNAVFLYVPHGTSTDTVFQAVCPIQTPQTYHFDNIGQLYTYLGMNNVWSDIGDITVKIAEKGITAFELEPYI